MKLFFSKILFITLFLTFVLCTNNALAQYGGTDVFFEVMPPQFEPGDIVNVKVRSYNYELGKYKITWFHNGKEVGAGIGRNMQNIRLGESGEVSEINVKIVAPGTGTISEYLTLTPTSVDLLWEAVDSYTPPFYKGKALASPQSRIKISALTDSHLGKEVNYSWNSDSDDLRNFSGYKKDFIYLSPVLLGPQAVSVNLSAKSIDNKASATASLSVPFINPQIIFYEKKDDGSIDYSKALGDTVLMKNSFKQIVAEPYFFETNKNNKLKFTWKINGVTSTNSQSNILPLRVEQNGGTATINIDISNINKMLQNMKKSLLVVF